MPCPKCGNVTTRIYSFAVGKSFCPHFNHSVGKYVSTHQEFTDALKRGSDEQSERTGMAHNYVPIDPADAKDMKAMGVTDSNLDEVKGGHYNSNIRQGWEPERRHFT